MPELAFNEKKLASLKPAKKETYYWDESFKGNRSGRFGLRVYPSGAKRYLYDFVSETHLRRRIVIGKYEDLDLAKARELAKSYAQDVSDGKDPSKDRLEKRTAITFAELRDNFLARRRLKLKPKTLTNYEQIIECDLSDWSTRRISEIAPRDVEAVLKKIVERGSKIQAERTREVIRTMFRFAMATENLPQSPCQGIEKVAETGVRTQKLDCLQVADFWKACDSLPVKMRNYFKILLLTAQRRGEIAAAKWTDIQASIDGQIWNFPENKSNRPHAIPISPLVLRLLKELRQHNGLLKSKCRTADKSRFNEYIFPSKYSDGKPHITDIRKPFKAICEHMKLQEHLVPHDLRRSAATLMREVGVSRDILKRILNHAVNDVTGIHYDQYDELPEMREALEIIADRILVMAAGRYVRRKRRAKRTATSH